MTTNRSDRGCFRGCVQEGVHYADCSAYDPTGVEAAFPCLGCAPAPTHKDTLLCEGCYERMRRLLRNAGDLLGRLQSLTEQGKAVVYQAAKVPVSSVVARDQVDPDLLDAIDDVSATVDAWAWRIGIWDRTLRGLDVLLADADVVERLSRAVLDVHSDEDRAESGWSVADAAARWGVERRDRDRHVYPVEGASRDGVIARIPVREWYDWLLVSKDAAERAGVSESQLRRWVQADVLAPVAKLRDGRGVVTRWFRASAVDEAAEIMRARRHAGAVKMPE